MKNIRKSATVFDFCPNEYKCKQIQSDLILINLYLHLLISQCTEDLGGGGQSNTPLINNDLTVINHILESF